MKELIITDAPLNYEGSIRRAFPGLVCFYAEKGESQRAVTLSSIWDLMLLSDEIIEVVLYRPELGQDRNGLFSTPLKAILPVILKTARFYPDLVSHLLHRTVRSAAEDCEFGFTLKLGANLTNLTVNGLTLFMKSNKPLCTQEDNNLMYLDLTRSQLPVTATLLSGLKKLRYLSLDSTGIKKLPNIFLQYYPALKVLKLSNVDIGYFIQNIDGDFFGSCPTLEDIYLSDDNLTKIPTTMFSRSVNLQRLDMSKNYLRSFDFDLQNCTKLNILNLSSNSIESITQERISELTQLAAGKTEDNNLVVDLSNNRLHCLCNSTHLIKWLQRLPAETNIMFSDFNVHRCLYPNGSTVRISDVIVSELEQQCSVIHTLVNGSDCPCDEEQRRRLQQVWVHLEGFFCRNDAGVLVAMKHWPLPSCFNPYTRVSFIAPLVIGVILAITVSVLICHRNTRPVRQEDQNEFAMLNREGEHAAFSVDMFIFVQDEDRSSIHTYFIEALKGRQRSYATGDDFMPGLYIEEALLRSIFACRWIVPVLTTKFLADPVCIGFIHRVKHERPGYLIPVVWENALQPTDASIVELLQTRRPLVWPKYEDKRNFWASLLDRTEPTEL